MIKAILYFDGNIIEEGADDFLMPAAAKVCAKVQGGGLDANKAIVDGYYVHWGTSCLPTYCVRHLNAAWGESSLFDVACDSQKAKYMDGDLLLTNSTFLLKFDRFTWDEEKQEFKVWFWDEHSREFRHINDLTRKELRRTHNIVKMYHNGGLDICPAWREYE